MNKAIDLKALERKAFRSTFQDGLWDLFVGLYVLSYAFVPFVPDPDKTDWGIVVTGIPASVVGLIALYLGKKYITAPRLGIVRFGAKRKASLWKLTAFLTGTAILGLGMFLLVNAGYVLRSGPFVAPFISGMVFTIAFGIIGYIVDFRRLFLYGALFGFAPLAGRLLVIYAGVPYQGYPVSFGIAGGLILAIGFFLLWRFIRTNPLPAEEDSDGTA